MKIVGAKVVKITRDFARKHYSELWESLRTKFGNNKGKKVYEEVLDYIEGKFHTNRVIALAYKGENAIKKVREIARETNPEKATPVSIRGKYGRIHSETGVFENVIHCSDSEANAKKEINLWFNKTEIVE